MSEQAYVPAGRVGEPRGLPSLRVPCPYCGVDTGRWCTTPDGRRTAFVHEIRVRAAGSSA